jgi:hypothetical protein
MDRVVPWARLFAVIEPLYPTQWPRWPPADGCAEDAAHVLASAVVSTAANVSDVTLAGDLLHGEETDAFGDACYCGVDKREEAQGPEWHIAMQPGKR